jgi:hypothetical protein
VPDETQTSVCAGPLYAFNSGQGILGRSGPHLGGSETAEALVRYAGVWYSLTGVRIHLMIPRYMLLLRGHLVVSGLSTWWGNARFLTIVRGTPVPGY